MTAQRLVRGSKVRLIATLAALIFTTGLLVLIHQQQTQLRNVKKNYEMCVQQQESLSTQLQVIVDYKTRLEKSLQSEKAEHKQTRAELEARINDEKTRRDKTSVEANLRFTSLQQHYKLLQRKHDDLKEKADKLQQQYMEETDKLQAKVKELQEQLKQSEKNKENSLEHLKSLYLQLDNDKKRLTEELKASQSDHAKWENDLNHMEKVNHQLQRKIEKLESERNRFHPEVEQQPQIPDQLTEKTNIVIGETIPGPLRLAKQVQEDSPAGDKPGESQHGEDISQVGEDRNPPAPISQNAVLQKPSSFSKSTPKTSSTPSNSQPVAHPLVQPTISPNSSRIEGGLVEDDGKKVIQAPNVVVAKKVPAGVVPVRQQDLQRHDQQQPEKPEDRNNIPDEIHMVLPNRYRHNIIESAIENERIKETKGDTKPNLQNEPELNMDLMELNPQDNAANEVLDGKNPGQEDPLHLMEQNAAAIEGNALKEPENIKDSVVHLIKSKSKKLHHGEGAKNVDGPEGRGAPYDGDGVDYDGQRDLQIEEAEIEGGEDDEDDYDGEHIPAQHKEPAVRN